VTAPDELRGLLQRYARAVDARDLDALSELFRPDAVLVGARGTQTFEEWLETMRGPRAFPTSMHVLGDPLITLGGNGTEATLDTYAVVYQLSDPDSGRGDLAVLEEGRWRIARRESHTVWMR
jgi:hypothetical protein